LTDAAPVTEGHTYLPLLQRLTELSPNWGLWKNADRALQGHGDLDSAAPKREWDAITHEFRRWSKDHGLGPVAICRHAPTVLFLIALEPERRSFYELDVLGRKYFRGWTNFRAEDLLPLFQIDSRGFREVRPGVEGVIIFTQNATRWGGLPNMVNEKAHLALDLLREDPDGVEEAAKLFGPARKALLEVIASALDGGWNRRAMLQVEARCVAGAFMEPHLLIGRMITRVQKKRCPILRTIFVQERRLPQDVDAWLERVAVHHPVFN
jgi:hypothetical protein